MGATNSGKTTMIEQLSDVYYPVMVGRELRKRFPPDYFDGQAAPAKTDELAFQIMCEGIQEAHDKAMIPIVDGQPRNQVQLEWCKRDFIDRDGMFECKFIHLWAPREIRVARAKARDTDEAKLKLSMDRMDGDVLTLYDLWLQLSQFVPADDMKVINTNLRTAIVEAGSFIRD